MQLCSGLIALHSIASSAPSLFCPSFPVLLIDARKMSHWSPLPQNVIANRRTTIRFLAPESGGGDKAMSDLRIATFLVH